MLRCTSHASEEHSAESVVREALSSYSQPGNRRGS